MDCVDDGRKGLVDWAGRLEGYIPGIGAAGAWEADGGAAPSEGRRGRPGGAREEVLRWARCAGLHTLVVNPSNICQPQ